MKELELLENKDTRESLIERIEVLSKVKELLLLPFGNYMTTELVAQYYEIPIETVKSQCKRNIDEFISDGYKLWKKSEITQLINENNGKVDETSVKPLKIQSSKTGFIVLDNEENEYFKSTNKGVALWTPRSILRLGMLLRDSKVAIEVRRQLFGASNQMKIKERKEIEFIEQLEECLKAFNIKGIKQYHILSYRIDYYIPLINIAIEYDENDHKYYSYEQHEGRQLEIEKKLGCRFIRLSDKNTHSYNIGLVIKELVNWRLNILGKVEKILLLDDNEYLRFSEVLVLLDVSEFELYSFTHNKKRIKGKNVKEFCLVLNNQIGKCFREKILDIIK